jgi:diguanylate cyclase
MSAHWKGAWLLAVLLASLAVGRVHAAGSLDALIARAEAARSSDPKSFQRILGQLEAQSDSADEDQKDRIAYLKAYGLIFEGRTEMGIGVAKTLGESAKDSDLGLRATLLTVNAYALNRQFTEGLRQLEKAMQQLPTVRSKEIRHQGLGVAAVLNQQIGQYRQALDYADRILQDSPDGRTRCLASQVQIESRQFLGLLSSDDGLIDSAIEHCIRQKEFAAANFIRIALARKWVDAGETKRAVSLIEKHLKEIERAKYPHLVAEAKAFLAELALEKGDLSAAENYARGVLSQSASVTSSLPLVKAYRTLYDIAERNGDIKEALRAYQSYAEADKAYLNEVKARELAYQIVRQETLQKTQQINLLDQQNQVLQLQRKVDQQAAQNNRLIVMLLIVLVASIGYWAFKIKRVQLSLKKMAETDALTGICNRHHFTIRAERALAECARNGEQAALIMYDLDHFKNINDRFGHGTGDWALKEVAEASKGFCRRIDVLGRLGGEEFAILMYGCDLRAAARVAEDCRMRLAQLDTRETGHVFAITGSFGVTSSMQSGYSLARLLSHADRQLYRAKHLGRNRVCVHENEQEHEPARAASNVLELPQRERSEHIGA